MWNDTIASWVLMSKEGPAERPFDIKQRPTMHHSEDRQERHAGIVFDQNLHNFENAIRACTDNCVDIRNLSHQFELIRYGSKHLHDAIFGPVMHPNENQREIPQLPPDYEFQPVGDGDVEMAAPRDNNRQGGTRGRGAHNVRQENVGENSHNGGNNGFNDNRVFYRGGNGRARRGGFHGTRGFGRNYDNQRTHHGTYDEGSGSGNHIQRGSGHQRYQRRPIHNQLQARYIDDLNRRHYRDQENRDNSGQHRPFIKRARFDPGRNRFNY